MGHVTHYQNVRSEAERQPDLDPTWLPIPFDVRGATRFMPMVRSNWSVRASCAPDAPSMRSGQRGGSKRVLPHAGDVTVFAWHHAPGAVGHFARRDADQL